MVDSDPREAGDWDQAGLQVSGLASRVAEAGPEGTTSVLAPGSWETVTQSGETWDTRDSGGDIIRVIRVRVRVITSVPAHQGHAGLMASTTNTSDNAAPV